MRLRIGFFRNTLFTTKILTHVMHRPNFESHGVSELLHDTSFHYCCSNVKSKINLFLEMFLCLFLL